MNTRGQIFSMIAVLMASLFILLFGGLSHVALDNKVPVITNEILRIDNFLVDLEYFMDTTIDKTSFEILRFTTAYLNTTSAYPNYSQTFTSCFTQGVFDDFGTPTTCSWTSENISFMKQIQPILANASNIYNVSIAYQEPEVSFRQYDAFLLEINATMFFTVSKPGMRWDVPISRSRLVAITGSVDPTTVATAFRRTIRPAPDEGDLFRAGDFAGNISLIKSYIDNGYYYRDFTGLSFVEALEGATLSNTSEYHPFGINAFVPLHNATGDSLYKGNQTSMILYQYTSNLTFTNPDRLVRFNASTGINSSLIFNKFYVLNNLRVNSTSPLLVVEGCCDGTGCNPLCGET